jgi:hypothetical protein
MLQADIRERGFGGSVAHRTAGVVDGDPVEFSYDHSLIEQGVAREGDSFASYGHKKVNNLDQQMTWNRALANEDGIVEVS